MDKLVALSVRLVYPVYYLYGHGESYSCDPNQDRPRYSLSFLVILSLNHFHRLGCVGSPVDVIIQYRQRCLYPVAMLDHSITCSPFLTQSNRMMDSWSITSFYNTLSSM